MESITRREAIDKVKQNVSDDKLRKHMYAVSDIMTIVAEELDRDVKQWSLSGLLHDIDYEKTQEDFKRHGKISADMVSGEVSEEILEAIRAHNFENTGFEPENDMDYGLIAADALSGLIVATALVMPDSSLEEVRVESVMKKIGDSSFAKSIDRDRIKMCEELGLELEKFVELGLEAMKKDSERLGL